MPPLEQSFTDQGTAVLWEAAGYNPSGKRVVYEPVEIGARWVWKQKLVTDASGNLVGVDATVVVDRDIPPDSLMWQGTLDDWPGTAIAPTDNPLVMVVWEDWAEDVKGREVEQSVKVRKYKDKLPAVTARP